MRNEKYLATWNTYQSAWSDISTAERRTLLESSVAANCVYTDPTTVAHGLDQLVAKIELSQQNRPGISFQNNNMIDHHDQGLSYWTMVDKTGNKLLNGASYARFGDDGRLTHMTGFFEFTAKTD